MCTPAGNRIRVLRVGGGDLNHWTTGASSPKKRSYRQLWIDLCTSIGFETLHYNGLAHQLRSDVIREIVYNVVEPSAHQSPKIVSTNVRRQAESVPSKRTSMSILEDQWERLIPGHLVVLMDELDGERDQEVEHKDGSDHSTKTTPSPMIARHETCVSPRCQKVLATNSRPTDFSYGRPRKSYYPQLPAFSLQTLVLYILQLYV